MSGNPQRSRGFLLPMGLPWMILGGTALAFGISTLMFWNLYRGAVNDYATYKAEIEAVNETLRVEHRRESARAEQATEDLRAGYTAAIVYLTDDYNSRLKRLSPRNSGGVLPADTCPARGADETAPDDRLAAYENAALKLEAEAAETTAQLVYLQDWVNKVCLKKKNDNS